MGMDAAYPLQRPANPRVKPDLAPDSSVRPHLGLTRAREHERDTGDRAVPWGGRTSAVRCSQC